MTIQQLNVVQNRHIHYIPHPKRVYFAITTIWSVYCQLSSIMTIYIAFAQIDLCLVRLAADITANTFTLSLYLNGKVAVVWLWLKVPAVWHSAADDCSRRMIRSSTGTCSSARTSPRKNSPKSCDRDI